MSRPTRELSARQLDVLKRIAAGQSWAQIGSDLDITVGGVGSIGKQILVKLGASSSAHAVHLAYQAGILRRERHGDHAGFVAHVRRGEDPWACEQGCPEGERAYRTQRRNQRKENAA
ncbi:response regulator transcription factor [Streptomyces sp. NPDC057596]|uniref:response regulator transcription factor n=1 Tax=Streptomyces sp. NPDC057596 TaxID=3346178 RepID=UPI0036D16A9D